MRLTGYILLGIGLAIALYGLAMTGLSVGAASEAGGVATDRHVPPGNRVPLLFGGAVAAVGAAMAVFGGRGTSVEQRPPAAPSPTV